MGFIDRLSGRRAPPAGAVPQDITVLRDALLDLNRETAPFVVRDGGPEGADLVAEWRIVDARWYEIFAKARIGKGAQVLLRLDEASGEVRSIHRDWTGEWHAGLPALSFASEVFRGQSIELSLGPGWAFREEDLQFARSTDTGSRPASWRSLSRRSRPCTAGLGVRCCWAAFDTSAGARGADCGVPGLRDPAVCGGRRRVAAPYRDRSLRPVIPI